MSVRGKESENENTQREGEVLENGLAFVNKFNFTKYIGEGRSGDGGTGKGSMR